jgi:hypothetical protein
MSRRLTRTFVLGAGFSAGGNIPTTDSLLKHALTLMHDECRGLFDRIEEHAQIFIFELHRDDGTRRLARAQSLSGTKLGAVHSLDRVSS